MNPQLPHTPPEADIQATIAKLKSPTKTQLQDICVRNGLTKSGNKADLSRRIELCKLALVLFLIDLFVSHFSPFPRRSIFIGET